MDVRCSLLGVMGDRHGEVAHCGPAPNGKSGQGSVVGHPPSDGRRLTAVCACAHRPGSQLHCPSRQAGTQVVMVDRLSGCPSLFWALPRGRGPMLRSWRRWACAQPCQHPGSTGGGGRLFPVLHCTNTYIDGCPTSGARQAVGGVGERWSSHEPRRGHPQARPVDG